MKTDNLILSRINLSLCYTFEYSKLYLEIICMFDYAYTAKTLGVRINTRGVKFNTSKTRGVKFNTRIVFSESPHHSVLN